MKNKLHHGLWLTGEMTRVGWTNCTLKTVLLEPLPLNLESVFIKQQNKIAKKAEESQAGSMKSRASKRFNDLELATLETVFVS